jgi:6-pyruvoyl-tetrahydropterin synthase
MILRPALDDEKKKKCVILLSQVEKNVRQIQGSVDFVVLVEMEDEERELTLKKKVKKLCC